MWSLLVYLSLSLVSQASSLTESCNGNCICGSKQVTCRGITEIPTEITGKNINSIEMFACVSCQIPILHSNSFAGYSILDEVTVHFSNVSEVELGAFSGLESRLTKLDLSDNSFERIRSHFFTGLTQLANLDLQTNQISEIEEGSFDGLTRLSSVLLKKNLISHLPAYLFSTTVLNQFDLSENSLNHLSSLPFPTNNPFNFIYFSDNNLVRIHSNMTSLFLSAGAVRLDGNPLVCDCYSTGLQSTIQSFPTKFSDSTTNPVTCGHPNRFFNMKLSNITLNPNGCEEVCLGAQCSGFGACFSVSDWPVCTCNPGFHGNGYICTDPCVNSDCVAPATCTYSPATMNTSCVCPINFQLDVSGKNCVEVIGCVLGLCPLNSTCLDTMDGFQCICNAGLNFTNSSNSLACVDVDECRNVSLFECPSNSSCANSLGNYSCECLQGFGRNSSEFCVDINECELYNISCAVNSQCNNSIGSYMCECSPGYVNVTQECVDIDECLILNTCPANHTCQNSNGTFDCVCKNGLLEESNGTCTDIDECLLVNFTCTANALCHNTFGSYSCDCLPGFEKVLGTCVDIDECLLVNFTCTANALCHNTFGSYSCDCLLGFEHVQGTCVDIDECVLGTHNCSLNQNCVNKPGSAECVVCGNGFLFVNNSCQDIDECGLNVCPNNSVCFNKVGFYECVCSAGYFPVNNGIRLECEDIILTPFCGASSESGFNWPDTSRNTTTTIVCPNNNQEFAKRNCNREAQWEIPDISRCLSPQIASLTDSLDGLSPIDPQFSEKLSEISTELSTALSDMSLIVSDYLKAVELFQSISSKSDSFIQLQRSFIPTGLAAEVFQVASSIVDTHILETIQEFGQSTVQSAIISILSSTETLTQNLVHTLFSVGNQTRILIETDNILVDIQRVRTENGFAVTFNTSSGDTRIDITLEAIQSATFSAIDSSLRNVSIESCETAANFFSIKNIQPFLTESVVLNFTRFTSWYCGDVDIIEAPNQAINSDHVSASLSSRKCLVDTSELEQGLVIVFRHSDTSLISSQCVYTTDYSLDMSGSVQWETLTCEKLPMSNGTHTFCNCTHLTSFAILMSPDPYYSSGSEMSIFSYVGLSISIVFLTVSLLLHFLKLAISESVLFVHRNLIFSILLSQIVFVFGIERNEVRELCLIVAALLHYILLVSFLWMLIEAVNALILIRRPFTNQFWLKIVYASIAYLLPFIVVSITLGISICDYGHYPLSGNMDVRSATTNCWLPRRHGRYWAFIGPALFIIFLNTILLFVIIAFILRLQFKRKRMRASSIKTSHTQTLAKGLVSAVKATLLMVPVLGITWIFGVFALNSINSTVSQVFQWLFLIFNCYQGVFIFVFFCLLNAELRVKLQLLFLRRVLRLRTNREDLKETGFMNIVRGAKVNNQSPVILHKSSRLSADGECD